MSAETANSGGAASSGGAHTTTIAARLLVVREAIARAAADAGRDPSSVRLVAVSKLHPAAALAEATAAGQRDFGENYAQELRDKARALPPPVDQSRSDESRPIVWHYIGPLQRNKVKYVVGTAALIHSVDNLSLLDEIARRAEAAGLVQACLLEVNVGEEPQKSGCSPDDLPALLDACRGHGSIRALGLMCIPPAGDPESTRPHFRALATLARDERARTGLALPELSMGMSADFPIAIAEGATLVRVGTAIFGERPVRIV